MRPPNILSVLFVESVLLQDLWHFLIGENLAAYVGHLDALIKLN